MVLTFRKFTLNTPRGQVEKLQVFKICLVNETVFYYLINLIFKRFNKKFQI